MGFLSRLRQKLNRDDGRVFQVGNRRLGKMETLGYLLMVGALFLWQLHDKVDVNGVWAVVAGVIGLLLAFLGNTHAGDASED